MVKNASGKSAYLDVDTQTWTAVTKSPPVAGGTGMAMYDTGKILLYAAGSTGTDSWVIDLKAASPTWRKVGRQPEAQEVEHRGPPGRAVYGHRRVH